MQDTDSDIGLQHFHAAVRYVDKQGRGIVMNLPDPPEEYRLASHKLPRHGRLVSCFSSIAQLIMHDVCFIVLNDIFLM